MVGESVREVHYQRGADQALRDVEAAFATIGKVLDSSPLTRTVTGRSRFGLQRIKLRVSIHDRGDGTSTLQIHSFGDDIWGGGARKGTHKLLRALDDVVGGR